MLTHPAGDHIGPVARLADLPALRFVAAVQPLLLEPRVVDAAVLLRVHPLLQVHGLLLGEDHQAAGEQEQAHHPEAALLQAGGQGRHEEQVYEQLHGAEEQDPAQGHLDGLAGLVLVPAVPGGVPSGGGAVEEEAPPHGHHRGDGDAPGRGGLDGAVQPPGQGGGIQAEDPAEADDEAEHAPGQHGDQHGQGELGQGFPVLAFLLGSFIHGDRPPDK